MLAGQLTATPRHLSRHPDGFMLTCDASSRWGQSSPRQWATARSSNGTKTISTHRSMTVDVFALGMPSCIPSAFQVPR